MEINNCNLLSLTVRKNVNFVAGTLTGDDVDGYNSVQINEDKLVNNSQLLKLTEEKCINLVSDTVLIGGKSVDLPGFVSDSQIEEIYNNVKKENVNLPERLTTTYADITPREISNIKQAIYALHSEVPEELHLPNGATFAVPKRLSVGSGSPSDPNVHIIGGGIGNGGNDDGDSESDDSSTKTTFLKNQYASIVDTDSLFQYFNNVDSSITKT